MKFTLLAAILATVTSAHQTEITENQTLNLKQSSVANLLSKSRQLEGQQQDPTWLVNYSIQFEGCHSILGFGAEGGGKDGESPLRVQNLVRYRLCKAGSCNRNCVGSYLVNLNEFVDSYTEHQMEAQEQACENVRENCNCEYANDDEACEYACYQAAGLSNCIEVQNENEEEFEVQRYLECRELEMNNNNNNNYNQNNYNNNNNNYYNQNYNNNNGRKLANNNYQQQYFVGPKCSSNGKKITLSVFKDEACSVEAPTGTYAKYMGGSTLPYSDESLVQSDCVECVKQDDNNNNNYNYNQEVSEMCQQVYQMSAKCEKDVKGPYYPSTDACTFIEKQVYTHDVSYTGGSAAKIFAWIFGISTAGLAYYVYTLHKTGSGKVNLSAQDGGMLS